MNPNPKQKPIRLKGKAYQAFRKQVFETHGGKCSGCGRFAPLYHNGRFDVFLCGHVSHRKSRGAGGSDEINNVEWQCYFCHIEKGHGPRWNGKEKT